jgi:hypothetical protein
MSLPPAAASRPMTTSNQSIAIPPESTHDDTQRGGRPNQVSFPGRACAGAGVPRTSTGRQRGRFGGRRFPL